MESNKYGSVILSPGIQFDLVLKDILFLLETNRKVFWKAVCRNKCLNFRYYNDVSMTLFGN